MTEYWRPGVIHGRHVLGRAEQLAVQGIARLLPAKWRRVVDLLAAPVPPTPTTMTPAPTDEAARRLDAVDHIVVLMMENRSFDHMLGYLSLPVDQGGGGRVDVDGLEGRDVNFNPLGGTKYAIHHLDRTQFNGEVEDPDHSGGSVDEQLANGGQGFVENFARISKTRAAQANRPAPDPGLVMGYYDAGDLPVYDHLASEYCLVDRWFSSVPGATWPNRLYALTGQASGSRDDAAPPIYALPSFVRYLDENDVDWRWYSFDPGTLRAADPAYRFHCHDRFAYCDARTLSPKERAAGELTEEGPSFLDDAAAGNLPSVAWIDPRFKDLRVLGPNSNDDHPPSDVLAGQDLVLTVYHALSSAPSWPKTLFLIVYDEHGGFYDHVPPPSVVDDHPGFRRLGIRVPALLVSPLVARASTSTALLGSDFHFDHTSIIKTILTRFCHRGGRIPTMTARVAAANHLGHLLAGAAPRKELPDQAALADRMTAWRAHWTGARFTDPIAAAGQPTALTDFQTGFYDMARRLREAGLPGGHP